MMTAKIFENGRSQAVRLPKECRFNLTKQLLTNWILESVWKARKNSKIESTDTLMKSTKNLCPTNGHIKWIPSIFLNKILIP